MEKELKSCTGVLLKADLTGSGQFSQSANFCKKRVGWLCPIRSDLKRTPVQDFKSFSIMFYYIFSTTYQKIGDLFCPVIFLDFRAACLHLIGLLEHCYIYICGECPWTWFTHWFWIGKNWMTLRYLLYGGHPGCVSGKHLFIIDAEKNLDEARRESYWKYFSTFYI